MTRTRSFLGPTAMAISVYLLLGTFTFTPTGAVPSDTFTVGLHLEAYDIEMLLSSEKDTSKVVPGWVDVDNMVPGETVGVTISATSEVYIYANPDPFHLTFDREGRQHFNLTVVLKEDTPPNLDFDVVVSAEGKTYIKSALSMVTLHVSLTYELSATAELVSFPQEVNPGKTVTGSLLVTNTGSVYGEYELRVVSDPDSVVKRLEFIIESALTPGIYEDFEFQMDIAKDAPTGDRTVTIELWASTQFETSERLDTFTVNMQVVEVDKGIDGIVVISLVLIVAVVLIVVMMLRRLHRENVEEP